MQQADWSTFKPTWMKSTDSTKAHYTGSVVGVGYTRKLKRGLGLHEARNLDVGFRTRTSEMR